MDYVYPQEPGKLSLENYSLILPAISVGNVGQLAVDLLLNNIPVEHIAYVHHPCFIPIVGADPFDPHSTKLATSCQLYACKDKQLAILQHRSPLIPSKLAEYRSFIVNFVKEYKIKRTILLCSSFSQFFTIEDLQGVPLHYLCSSSMKEEKKTFSRLSWKQFSLPDKVDPLETSLIPGGGVAKSLLEDFEKETLPLAVLILVCSEGNNYPEAFQMVEKLNCWIQVCEPVNKWKMPVSWTLPYGSGAPQTIY